MILSDLGVFHFYNGIFCYKHDLKSTFFPFLQRMEQGKTVYHSSFSLSTQFEGILKNFVKKYRSMFAEMAWEGESMAAGKWSILKDAK